MSARLVRVGVVLRYAREDRRADPELDGYPNYHFLTTPAFDPEAPKLMLEKGVSQAAVIGSGSLARRPVVSIRSSPWKAGQETNPWHDKFDLDRGHVRYYGDHKASTVGEIGATSGNAVLLEALAAHTAATVEERRLAPPLLVYRAETVYPNGRPVHKGHVEFCGVAVIERLEKVVQTDDTTGLSFPNLELDLIVLDLSDAGDAVDMRWIDDRRDPSLQIEQTERYAPVAWRTWVEEGRASFPRIRRRVGPSGDVRSATEPRVASTQGQSSSLLAHYVSEQDRDSHVADVGMAWHDSAADVSAANQQVYLPEGREGETARREVTTYRVVRDSQVARQVKELHDHHCQVCGLRLRTRSGGYSEAAHIRGLGAPHNGPDDLTNLLCLCPNHHVLFDMFTIYVDRDGIIRNADDQSEIGKLRYHPRHVINAEHVSYHRQLCGRDS